MKRYTLFLLLAVQTLAMAAVPKLTLADLQNGGWQQYKGQRIQLTTPLIVCATMYDSLILSPERLYAPEEHAYGLADGDSTLYYQIKAHNAQQRIKLECKYPYHLNLGATVTNLQAVVQGERHLVTGAQPHFKNYKPSKQLPKKQPDKLRICAANIQNYFVHVGGYATRRTTPGMHAFQCLKTASALVKINADIYTICELEQGDEAPRELVAKMNELTHSNRFAFVVTDTLERDTISVGFIYNQQRVAPYGPLRFAYHETDSATAIYAHRFMLQGWEQLSNHARFVISLNHPRSRRGTPQEASQKRMNNAKAILNALAQAQNDSVYHDEDYLLLGDYNAYAQEPCTQALVRAGYIDMVMALDSTNYTYNYRGECGYLDRCYASPTMAGQIEAIQPLHWNTDYYYSAAYYSKYNYKNRKAPQDVPKNIRRQLLPVAKRNILFRYADHDPLLITLKLQYSGEK